MRMCCRSDVHCATPSLSFIHGCHHAPPMRQRQQHNRASCMYVEQILAVRIGYPNRYVREILVSGVCLAHELKNEWVVAHDPLDRC